MERWTRRHWRMLKTRQGKRKQDSKVQIMCLPYYVEGVSEKIEKTCKAMNATTKVKAAFNPTEWWGGWESNLLPRCYGQKIREHFNHHDIPKGNTHRLIPPLPVPPPSQDPLRCSQEPQTSCQRVWTIRPGGRTEESGQNIPNEWLLERSYSAYFKK